MPTATVKLTSRAPASTRSTSWGVGCARPASSSRLSPSSTPSRTILAVRACGASAYAFAEGTLEMSDRFDAFVSPGVGPGVGVLHDFSQRWRTGLFFDWRYFPFEGMRNDYETVAQKRVTLNARNIVGLDLSWRRDFGHGYSGAKLYWQFYF